MYLVSAGVVAAWISSAWLATLLHEVRPVDAVSFGGAVLIVSVCAVAACLPAAGRASRVDPARTLRAE